MSELANAPTIAFGLTRHNRKQPAANSFSYPSLFLRLPMRSLQNASTHKYAAGLVNLNAWAPLSFKDADHGVGDGNSVAWLDQLLRSAGVEDAQGELWLHTFPRYWGYAFKPVSFWFAHRTDNTVAAIVAEVNNTFGEKHCYLLKPEPGSQHIKQGALLSAHKVFHVSPFMAVEGYYQFRFINLPHRSIARIDYFTAKGLMLETSISGSYKDISLKAAAYALVAYPLHAVAIVARIHWQAFKLWCKRVRFHHKPVPPDVLVSTNDPKSTY